MRKCLVVCWYGSFPNYFQLFLNSCGKNESWNWLIFSDAKYSDYNVPKNVCFINMCFDDLCNLIENKLEFRPPHNMKSYKLCDYRPTYGILFSEYLKEYDYWGHCDIDVIFGRLSYFFPDELICKYDRFLSKGHFTLYRNTSKNNLLYKEKISRFVDWHVILSSLHNWGFDEVGRYSISTIQNRSQGYTYYFDNSSVADITPFEGFNIPVQGGVRPVDYVHYDQGKIICKIGMNYTEYAYVHLQKRNITSIQVSCNNDYFIYGNTISDKVINEKEIIKKTPSKLHLRWNQLLRCFDIFKYYIKGIK